MDEGNEKNVDSAVKTSTSGGNEDPFSHYLLFIQGGPSEIRSDPPTRMKGPKMLKIMYTLVNFLYRIGLL